MEVALPTGAMTPVSRGAPCEYSGMPAGPCRLTDGKLEPVLLFDRNNTTGGGLPPRSITVRLPTPRPLRGAVIRGFWAGSFGGVPGASATLVIDGSADDGATFVPLASLDMPLGSQGEARTDARDGGLFRWTPLAESAPPVDRVRLRLLVVFPDGPEPLSMLLYQMSEISLFE